MCSRYWSGAQIRGRARAPCLCGTTPDVRELGMAAMACTLGSGRRRHFRGGEEGEMGGNDAVPHRVVDGEPAVAGDSSVAKWTSTVHMVGVLREGDLDDDDDPERRRQQTSIRVS